MKKEITLMIAGFMLGLFLLVTASALGTQSICLNEGDKLYYSDCSPSMPDYICTKVSCNLCVNEIKAGIYCPDDGCTNTCTYLYDEPEPPVIAPPIEDTTRVVLINPEDGFVLEAPGQVTFSFKTVKKSQIAYFKICELSIDGEVVDSVTGPHFSPTQYNLKATLGNGEHDWRIYCTERDSDGGQVIMSEQRTIGVGSAPTAVCGNGAKEGSEECDDGNKVNGDGCSSTCKIEQETQTDISLVSPSSGYSATGTQNIDFKFSVPSAMVSGISSCNLVLNSNNVGNITSISTQNTISYSVSPGSYSWKIECKYNSQTKSSISRTLTINTPTTPTPHSSGGGGGGGSSSIYVLTAAQLDDGYSKDLAKGAGFKFTLLNGTHTLTVNEVTATSAKVTVASTPQTFSLGIGEEKKIDINGDETYDLAVELVKITGTKANIKVEKISEIILGKSSTDETSQTTKNTTTSETQINQSNAAGITGGVIGFAKNNKIAVALGFVIIIVILGLISFSSGKKNN